MSEERNIINISVSGVPGSGKSRITYLLKEFLKDRGFNIEMSEDKDFKDEAQFDEFMGKNVREIISNFSKTKIIKIEAVSLNRNLKNKS